MIDGLAIEVGDGRTTRFWEDTWLQIGKLKDCYPRLFCISNKKGSPIWDCGFWDGIEWVWHFQWRRELRQWESETLDQLLNAFQFVRLIAEVQDRVVWKFDKEGVYTTNSFVQVLQEATLDEDILRYRFTKEIWRGFVLPRVELFSWFALIGRINTKDWLSRLGILGPHDNLCVLCKKAVESVHYLLVACEFSWQVWCGWSSEFGLKWTAPGTLKDHFESWRYMHMRQEVRKFWLVGFFSMIWNIWLRRNDAIFQNKTAGVVEYVAQSFLSAAEWCEN
ncbi:uncharacterized protein LOC107647279 [Arachis ipaensis]|uniref:uncharacterized protein LOC107647279 n=1 Tax=Arachis ipaensis TaxID=130454 RepID=UPI0007AF1563|nr:uncharacterized protein LOC107647279 [Arachis ipaensis]